MTDAIQHDTLVLSHDYPVSPARLFRAWSNAEARKEWDVIGADVVVIEHSQTFEVGGTEITRYGPTGNACFYSEGTFKQIIPDQRVVETGSFHVDGKMIAASVVTLEFLEAPGGTRLKLTDQSVYFDQADGLGDRRKGWSDILTKLERHLGTPNNPGVIRPEMIHCT